MKFTINAYKNILGLDDTFRLKKDEKWIAQEDFKTIDQDEDMTFDSIYEARDWIESIGKVFIDGEEVTTTRGDIVESNLLSDDFEFEIILHRSALPKNHYPTLDQLKTLIVNGDDNYENMLIINFDGEFELKRLFGKGDVLRTKNYAVRCEPFQPGNNYVGTKLALEDIEDLYYIMLEGWLLHLETGRSIYQEGFIQSAKEKIEKLVEDIKKELLIYKK